MDSVNVIPQYGRYVGLLMFPFVLPLPLPLNIKSAALILFFVTLLLNAEKGRLHLKNIFTNKIIILFALLFLLEPMLSLIRNGTLAIAEVRLPFIIGPLLFYLSKPTLVRHKHKIFYSFIPGVFGYLIFAVGYVIYFYTTSKFEVFELDYYLKYVLYHHLPYAVHHTYLGLFISFASMLILFTKQLNKQAKILLNIPLFLSVFIVGSKFSIILYCLLILIFVFWELRNNRKKFSLVSVVFVTTIVFSGYLINTKTDLFRTMEDSINIRKEVFLCSFSGIKDNFLIGVGRKGVKDYVENCTGNPEIRMDTHNLLLQEFLSNGILAFAALLLLFYVLFKKAVGDIKFLVFIFLFFSLGMLEHTLSLQNGVTFFVFFSLLFIFTQSDATYERQ